MIHIRRNVSFPDDNQPVIDTLKTESSYRSISRLGEHICTGEKGQLVTDSIWSAGWHAYMNLMTKLINAKPDEKITTKSRKGTGQAKEKPVYAVTFSIRSHDLRHTFASMLYDAGVDVKTAQKLLGHTNPEITMRIYTHLSQARQAASIDKMIEFVNTLSEQD